MLSDRKTAVVIKERVPRIILNNKQEFAYCDILDFIFNKNKSAYVLSGVAGSGKTTMIAALLHLLEHYLGFSIAVASYTGRATTVLCAKLREREYLMYTVPTTCHKLLYNTRIEDGRFVFNKIPPLEIKQIFDIIVIDEAQMVSEELFNDIMDVGLPVIFVGDKEQLPPIVRDENSNKDFNVMACCDYHLSDIIRQANESPIIRVASGIIKTGHINMSVTNDAVKFMKKSDITIKNISRLADVILTGTNRTRSYFNALVRASKKIQTNHASEDEIVMCMRNSCDCNGTYIANGERFIVESFSELKDLTINGFGNKKAVIQYRQYSLARVDYDVYSKVLVNIPEDCWVNEQIRYEDFSLNCPVDMCFFTFGYAMSVWKACGSEFDSVLFFDEDVSYFADRRRFRYTAVTRAKDRLIVVR